MGESNYRPRWYTILGAFLAFLVFLAGAAWLSADHDKGFGWILLHDFVQALGAVAFAVLGVTGIFGWRWRRRWKGAIQVIAVDLLNTLLRETVR